jgi:hypothetical protein
MPDPYAGFPHPNYPPRRKVGDRRGQPAPPRSDATFPTARLERLGVSELETTILRRLWEESGPRSRTAMAAKIAVAPDQQMKRYGPSMLIAPTGAANVVIAWVQGHPAVKAAASVALIAERRRDLPRTRLITQLERLKGVPLGAPE